MLIVVIHLLSLVKASSIKFRNNIVFFWPIIQLEICSAKRTLQVANTNWLSVSNSMYSYIFKEKKCGSWTSWYLTMARPCVSNPKALPDRKDHIVTIAHGWWCFSNKDNFSTEGILFHRQSNDSQELERKGKLMNFLNTSAYCSYN